MCLNSYVFSAAADDGSMAGDVNLLRLACGDVLWLRRLGLGSAWTLLQWSPVARKGCVWGLRGFVCNGPRWPFWLGMGSEWAGCSETVSSGC